MCDGKGLCSYLFTHPFTFISGTMRLVWHLNETGFLMSDNKSVISENAQLHIDKVLFNASIAHSNFT